MVKYGVQKVNWTIGFPSEVKSEYVGVKISDYFKKPEVRVNTQIRAAEILHEKFRFPEKKALVANEMSYVCASVLGARIAYFDEHEPRIADTVIKDLSQVEQMKVPDIKSAGLIPEILEMYEYMKKKAEGTNMSVSMGVGVQGPMTTAVLLRGQSFFQDLYDEPKICHKLLNVITDTAIAIMYFIGKAIGVTYRSIGIGDDYAGLLSPSMYEEFNIPYLKRIYETFGQEGRSLHCETLKYGHLRYMEELGLSSFDPGNNNDVTLKGIMERTLVPFSWNLHTTRDLLFGTPETIRHRYENAVTDGATFIKTEVCPGTPEENIIAYMDVAEEYGPKKRV